MKKLILLYTFLAFGLHGYGEVRLDSLFVETLFNSTQNDELRIYTLDEVKREVADNYHILSNYSFTNDTIFIIISFSLEGSDYYNIIGHKLRLRADSDSNKVIDLSSQYSNKIEHDLETEWIKNWETDSLKKYGVQSMKVHDGFYRRYVARYIIKNDSVMLDSINYIPHIDVNYDWWHKQK